MPQGDRRVLEHRPEAGLYHIGQGEQGTQGQLRQPPNQSQQAPNQTQQASLAMGATHSGTNPHRFLPHNRPPQGSNPRWTTVDTHPDRQSAGMQLRPPETKHSAQPQAYTQAVQSGSSARGEMSSEQLSGMFKRKEQEEQAGTIPPWEPPNSQYSSRWDLPEQTEAMKAGLASEQLARPLQNRALPGFGRGYPRSYPRDRPGESGPRGMSGVRGAYAVRGKSGRRGTTGMRRSFGTKVVRDKVPEPNNARSARAYDVTSQSVMKSVEGVPRGAVRGRGTTSRPGYQPVTTYIGYNKELVRARMASPIAQPAWRPDRVDVDARQDGTQGLAARENGVKEREKGPVTMSVLNKDGEEVVHVLDDSDVTNEPVNVDKDLHGDDDSSAQTKFCKEALKTPEKAMPMGQNVSMPAKSDTAHQAEARQVDKSTPSHASSTVYLPKEVSETPRSLIKSRIESVDKEENPQCKGDRRSTDTSEVLTQQRAKSAAVSDRGNAEVNMALQSLKADEISPDTDSKALTSSHARAEPSISAVDTDVAKVKVGPIETSKLLNSKPTVSSAENKPVTTKSAKSERAEEKACLVQTVEKLTSDPQTQCSRDDSSDSTDNSNVGQRVTRAGSLKTVGRGLTSSSTAIPQPTRGRQIVRDVRSKSNANEKVNEGLRQRAGSQSNIKDNSATTASRVSSSARSGSMSRLSVMRERSILGFFRRESAGGVDRENNGKGGGVGGGGGRERESRRFKYDCKPG